MNIQRRIDDPSPLTPHRFTAEEYHALWASSLHKLDKKFELLDGVIYEMPSDGPLTIEWTSAINRFLITTLGPEYIVVCDQTLRLSEHWAPDPDFYIFDAEHTAAGLKPDKVRLIIEVSNTTLKHDLGPKADAYAEHGIREYWVVDPNEKCLHVHRRGDDGAYGAPRRVGFNEAVEAAQIPGLTLKLSDLPRIS